mmetsp:Transcript_45860/g.109199  ORF Transcript_45860/g.109199 Transcript_45860/m.109199 type:complete len:828 (+) Transcript_45860:84-2567(+)
MSAGNLPGTVEDSRQERLEDEFRSALEELLTSKLAATARQLRSELREDVREILAGLSSELLHRVGPSVAPKLRPSRQSSTSTGGASEAPSGIVSGVSDSRESARFPSKGGAASKTAAEPVAPRSEWMMRHRKSFIAGGLVIKAPYQRGGGAGGSKGTPFRVSPPKSGNQDGSGEGSPPGPVKSGSCDGHLHVPPSSGRRTSRASSRSKSPRSPMSPGLPTSNHSTFNEASCFKHPAPPTESPRPTADLRTSGLGHAHPCSLEVEGDHFEPLSDGSVRAVKRQGTESETSVSFSPEIVQHPFTTIPSKNHGGLRTLTLEEVTQSKETLQMESPAEGPAIVALISKGDASPQKPKRTSDDGDESEMRDSFGVPAIPRDDSKGGTASKSGARLFRGESHVVKSDRRGSPSREFSTAPTCLDRLRWRFAPFVCNEYYDIAAGILICIHAVLLGFEADIAAARARDGESQPLWVQFVAFAFSCVFVVEVMLRIFAYGDQYFNVEQWRWNVFDLAVVLLHLTEEVVQTSMRVSDLDPVEEIGSLGVLQGLRLVRIIRAVRVVQYMHELRSMLLSVFSTLRYLASALVMLFFLIYLASIYVTQQVAFFGRAHPDRVEIGTDLHAYFGSIGRCTMSLFQAITNGVDWRDLSDPLTEEISPAMAVVLSAYIAFMTVSLLNMITGMFVESALEGSRLQADADIVSKLRDIFDDMGVSDAGLITWQDFKAQMDNPRMVGVFRSIDLDPSEARSLFGLLDLTESGSIDAEDFVMGCLRLRGPAKSIDLATLMSETRRMNMQWQEQVGSMSENINAMRRELTTFNGTASAVSESESPIHR